MWPFDPKTVLTSTCIQTQVHMWPDVGEISSNSYEDIVFTRCCDLDLWPLTFWHQNLVSTFMNQNTICDQNRTQFPSLVFEIRLSGHTDSLTDWNTRKQNASGAGGFCWRRHENRGSAQPEYRLPARAEWACRCTKQRVSGTYVCVAHVDGLLIVVCRCQRLQWKWLTCLAP